MICENCGTEMQNLNQKFCQNCGISLRKKIVFQYNDEISDYQILELEGDKPLYELLSSDYILLFVDPRQFRVWIWQGSNTTTRMRFVSARIAPRIRDQYGIAFKITSVDEGNETLGFKIMVGMEEENDNVKGQNGPIYEGTDEDLELFESLSQEKKLLLSEKVNELQKIQIFEVIEDPKTSFYAAKEVIKGEVVGDIICKKSKKKVFLLVDHSMKIIWTYYDHKSSIRDRIYGGIFGMELGRQLRKFYKVNSLNKFSQTDKEFQDLMKRQRGSGRAKSINLFLLEKGSEHQEIINIVVVLSYFHRKIGPLVFYKYPPLTLVKDLSVKVASIMDQQFNEGFFIHSFENSKSMNYYFEISSDWGRRNKETLMSSIITTQQISPELEDVLSSLCRNFAKELQSAKDIFTGLYIDELSNYNEIDKERIRKSESLIKELLMGLYWETMREIIKEFKMSFEPAIKELDEDENESEDEDGSG